LAHEELGLNVRDMILHGLKKSYIRHTRSM